MTKGIIFDLDGTTADTVGDINSALNKTLSSSFTDEECNAFMGNGLKNCLISGMRALGYSEDYIKEHVEEKNKELLAYYAENPVEHSKPYKGVPELFEYLNSKNIKIGIFSNKEHGIFLQVVNTLFPNTKFEFLCGRNWKYPAKPAPDAVWAFRDMCGADSDEILYVGDSEVDYKCAKDSGVPCLILTGGSRTREFLLEHGVGERHLIDTIDGVRKHVVPAEI